MEANSKLEPTKLTVRKVDELLRQAMVFQKTSQDLALQKGRKLTQAEVEYAVNLGIKHPEKIRVHYRWVFPKPQDKALSVEFNKLGFGSWFEGGRTHGYGIFIKSYFPYKEDILHHELVHVMQAEAMGLSMFTRQYLIEAMTYNYFKMPLEVEAFERTEGENF